MIFYEGITFFEIWKLMAMVFFSSLSIAIPLILMAVLIIKIKEK